jgi:hypothetical protein
LVYGAKPFGVKENRAIERFYWTKTGGKWKNKLIEEVYETKLSGDSMKVSHRRCLWDKNSWKVKEQVP